MAFLGGLFKRKPGGTLIGNLLRGVASSATGGLLGSGAGMISQLDADIRDLSDAAFSQKYGWSKTEAKASEQAGGVPYKVASPAAAEAAASPSAAGAASTPAAKTKKFFQQKWVRTVGLILGCITLFGIIYWISRGKKRNRRRYR